jgi:TRAP-type mannitol/chloroaromatic compound transport system permease small subunit
MLRLAAWIDALNEALGRAVAWLVLIMALVQFATVLTRYVYGVGSIWLQESVIYLHATLFLLAMGYALRHDAHVRVDVWYRGASARAKAIVDLVGAVVFLLPFTALVFTEALPYVMRSWRILEGSRETGGIAAVYLLKSLILVFAVTLGLQGVSLALRAWHRLRTADPA